MVSIRNTRQKRENILFGDPLYFSATNFFLLFLTKSVQSKVRSCKFYAIDLSENIGSEKSRAQLHHNNIWLRDHIDTTRWIGVNPFNPRKILYNYRSSDALQILLWTLVTFRWGIRKIYLHKTTSICQKKICSKLNKKINQIKKTIKWARNYNQNMNFAQTNF